jgi:multicomponent Na+:H+ antiporter subunit F
MEKMSRKIIAWFIGMLFLVSILLFIIMANIPSLLSWQSSFLSHCFFILIFCFGICLLRVIKGPLPADRAVAMNTLGVMIVGFCAILSIPTGRDWYLDIAIAWALQSFIGALALAKYLEGRGFDE